MQIEPIGYLRTCFPEKFGIPRQAGLAQSAWAQLELVEDIRSAEAVRGLEGFSHVWLIFGFHLVPDGQWKPTVRPPRLGGEKRIGVFASRSPFRPNGLGLSLVKLEQISFTQVGDLRPPVLEFSGVDLVDRTPIYDIKPYIDYADSVKESKKGYVDGSPCKIEVRFTAEAEEVLKKLPPDFRALAIEVLAQDPRPRAMNTEEERVFGVNLENANLRFQVRNGICEVLEIAII